MSDGQKLSRQQVKFLDRVGDTTQDMRTFCKEQRVPWRRFMEWRHEPAFDHAWHQVIQWFALVRETDVRLTAVEHMRQMREAQLVGKANLKLIQAGRETLHLAREVDGTLPRKYRPTPPGEVLVTPLHPDHAKNAEAIVQRMESLRQDARKQREAEMSAKAKAAARRAELLARVAGEDEASAEEAAEREEAAEPGD